MRRRRFLHPNTVHFVPPVATVWQTMSRLALAFIALLGWLLAPALLLQDSESAQP